MKHILRLTIALLIVALLCGFAYSQKRKPTRRTKRTRTTQTQPPSPSVEVVPFTKEQQAALDLAESRAEVLEATYKYNSEAFSDDAYRVAELWKKAANLFPAGDLQKALFDLGELYEDMGFLYGVATNTGEHVRTTRLLDESSRIRGEGGGNHLELLTRHIIAKYRLEGMSLYDAQSKLFQLVSTVRRATASPE